jgi:hypothetical protein
VSTIYSDLDKLVLERWEDVRNLAQAQRDVQGRIEEVIGVAGDRVSRWLRDRGYDSECEPADAQFLAWRPAWADRRRGAKVSLALGGFCPLGYYKSEEPHPFLWVYTDGLENYKVKEAGRVAFVADLRRALGPEIASQWEDQEVDDADAPLGQYLRQYGVREQCGLVSNPDALFRLAVEQYPKLFALADAIDSCLAKLQD